jgi:putative membrane protein
MMWDDPTGWGMHSGSSWFALVLLLTLIASVVGALVWAKRAQPTSRRGPGGLSPDSPDDPEQILRRRFAAGEIDEDEFLRRMSVLDSGPRR